MYAALWRRLPGPTWARVLLALLLLLAVVAVLFLWVFPWLSPHLPFDDVTLDPQSGVAQAATNRFGTLHR